MVAWYIYLHAWLIFYGFHVGKYTGQPWILWEMTYLKVKIDGTDTKR